MVTPAQMFDRRLNPTKGWPSPYALDKAKELTEGDETKAGMIMHVDPVTNRFKRGLPDREVPIFAWNSEGDFDAGGVDEGNISNYGNMKGLSGLVCLGAFEVETTEFVAGEVYAPNTPLKVNQGDVLPADLGKVMPGEFYTNTIVGVVSDGQSANTHGRQVVACWTYFLPSLESNAPSSSSSPAP
jgi:hypothetical protein